MTWKSCKKIALALAIIALAALCGPAPRGEAADTDVPVVDREAAEEVFLEGYDFFLANKLWNSIDLLREAQARNIYFVDTYFLSSLALRRLGRYPEAIDAMAAYLEVRADDHRGGIILDAMREEWEMINRTLNPKEIEVMLSF
ncbi:MAG: hypothetical protein LBT08_11115, partial [Synergistaceae bacterium]|nr:hypothetical protein [Synergistaceae bacterium]